MKLKYFLDHPQIKRNKSVGNGNTPRTVAATPSTTASAAGGRTPDTSVKSGGSSIAQQINFGGKFRK